MAYCSGVPHQATAEFRFGHQGPASADPSGRASLPVHLVSKEPKGHLDVRKPSHLQNVGQHRPVVTPRSRSPCIFAGVSADSSPVGLWSEKLGQSRWSLPEHTIRISLRFPFWSPPLHLTPPSISAGASRRPKDSRVACGWRRPPSQWGAAYGRCTSSPCSPSSCRHRCPTTSGLTPFSSWGPCS